MAAIRVVEYRPGSLVMTSREFGTSWRANVLCPDGSLGMGEERCRLEIRMVGCCYEVFFLIRSYLPGRDPVDIEQQPQNECFATLGEAADYVGQHLAGYLSAAADDRASRVEAQRLQDLANA